MSSATEFLVGDIKRRLHHLEIYLKSAPIEAAMKHVSGERKRAIRRNERDGLPGWGEHQVYDIPFAANGLISTLPGFNNGRFDLWGSRELICSRPPPLNLSPLITVGLEDGVRLNVPTVISDGQLTQYLDGLKSAVRQFYIDYLKDSNVSIRITTETISS